MESWAESATIEVPRQLPEEVPLDVAGYEDLEFRRLGATDHALLRQFSEANPHTVRFWGDYAVVQNAVDKAWHWQESAQQNRGVAYGIVPVGRKRPMLGVVEAYRDMASPTATGSYALAENTQHRGLATAGMRKLGAIAAEVWGTRSMELIISDHNAPSLRVALRLGARAIARQTASSARWRFSV